MASHEQGRYGLENFRLGITPLSLGPSLRAWSQAGLTHILLEGPVAALYEELTARPAPMLAASPTASFREPGEIKKKPVAATAESSKGASSPEVAETTALGFVSSAHISKNITDWPEPWRAWATKVTGAPVLWTYHNLGADLVGAGRSPARSAFLRDIIAELRLPRGSSVFWPCAMPTSEGALQADGALFAAGVMRLMPQIVVVFGETAMADIGLSGQCKSFQQVMVDGKLLVLLPEIENLLEGAAQRSSAVSLLRALFSSIVFG